MTCSLDFLEAIFDEDIRPALVVDYDALEPDERGSGDDKSGDSNGDGSGDGSGGGAVETKGSNGGGAVVVV